MGCPRDSGEAPGGTKQIADNGKHRSQHTCRER